MKSLLSVRNFGKHGIWKEPHQKRSRHEARTKGECLLLCHGMYSKHLIVLVQIKKGEILCSDGRFSELVRFYVSVQNIRLFLLIQNIKYLSQV